MSCQLVDTTIFVEFDLVQLGKVESFLILMDELVQLVLPESDKLL